MHMNAYCGHSHYQSLLHKGGFLLCFFIYIFLDYGDFYSVEQCPAVCGRLSVVKFYVNNFQDFLPSNLLLLEVTIGNILTFQVPSMPPK